MVNQLEKSDKIVGVECRSQSQNPLDHWGGAHLWSEALQGGKEGLLIAFELAMLGHETEQVIRSEFRFCNFQTVK